MAKVSSVGTRENSQPVHGQKDLIQVPLVTWWGASVLQLIRVVLPKFQTPLADGLVGHIDAALKQEFLHVAVAQREAIGEPAPWLMTLPGKRWFL